MFDFHSTYINKSNVDLLSIILQKDLFQEEAVSAAENILATRTVTDEERDEAENLFISKTATEQSKKEKQQKLANDADRMARSILFPGDKKPAYFIRVFAIGFLVIWLINIIPDIPVYISLFATAAFDSLLITALDFSPLLIIYWLYRLDKKGWVLLMLYFTLIATAAIYSFIWWLVPRDGFDLGIDKSIYVVRTGFAALVFYFSNRKDVLETLQVSRKTQLWTLACCGGLVAIYFLLQAGF